MTGGGLCLLALEGKFAKRLICAGTGVVALFAGLLNLSAGSRHGVSVSSALLVTLVLGMVSGFLLPVAYLARKRKRAADAVNDKQRQSGYAMAGIQ